MTRPPAAEIKRCPWAGADPEYQRYHDREWGVPLTRDEALFEKLMLEGFQAGLSWITILRKRPNFRRAFDGFDAKVIAAYQAKDVTRLMKDEGIVRNRAKIEATIDNAKAYARLGKRMTLREFLSSFLDAGPVQNARNSLREIPARTAQSDALSKDLAHRGFKFVGSTICYAFMQAVGMVNDHTVDCFRWAQVRGTSAAWEPR